jgi:Ca2+-binding RTX toxin-like protein
MDMRARTVLLAAALSAVVLVPSGAWAGTPECFGKKPTIRGDSGDNRLTGTKEADVIVGLRGEDHILGRGGRDLICAGPGDDVVGGQGGKDRITGQGDDDSLYGGKGDDRIFAGEGSPNDLLGNAGDDLLQGGPGFERLFGQKGADTMRGAEGMVDRAVFVFSATRVVVDLVEGTARGEGRDTLKEIEDVEGSRHDDALRGNRDANWFFPRAGADTVDGRGSDGDVVSLDGAGQPVTATVSAATGQGADTFARIEGLQGSRDFGDSLTGGGGPNLILGIRGPDELFGLANDDWLDGGQGNDAADGGSQVTEDVCIEVEDPVDCEQLGPPSALRVGAVPGTSSEQIESAIPPTLSIT